MLNACTAGAGIAQIMAIGTEPLLQSGQLIELFPLYAYYPSKKLPPAKLRAFLNFVLQLASGAKIGGNSG